MYYSELPKLESYMELRRARWLEKISHMEATRMPRKLLGAWINQARRNGKSGRSQNTIRHAYADSLRTLGFSGNFQFAEKLKTEKNGVNELKIFYIYLTVHTAVEMQRIGQLNSETIILNNN